VKWLALLTCALLAGCGGSQPAAKPARRATDRLAEARPSTPLRLCDQTKVELVTVAGAEAVDTWRELRREAGSSGLWPVVIGSPEDAAGLIETVKLNCEDGNTFERTLQRAEKVDVDRAIARVARAYGVRARDLRGSAPLRDAAPADRFVVPFDFNDNPFPEVWIALLPIDAGWKGPAILPWGNYNDNPGPAVHTAVLHRWSERYGAELVSMTADVLELSVTRPPTTDAAALEIAREQYSYAPDIVEQGIGDVDALAATLKNGHAWFFWWD